MCDVFESMDDLFAYDSTEGDGEFFGTNEKEDDDYSMDTDDDSSDEY